MTTTSYGTLWNYGTNPRMFTGIDPNNNKALNIFGAGTGIYSTSAFTLNTWVFYTLVQPANNGQPYVFQDTTKVNVATYGALNYTTTTKHALFYDVVNPISSAYGMKGYISNLVIYQFALSDAQVTQLYNS